MQPIPGQRWVSDSEPELGLGIILKAEYGRVEVVFPAAKEQRQYALKTAPLRRVEFSEGESIKLHDGTSFIVESVEDRKGIRYYTGCGRVASEAELSDLISFSTPEDRLLAGQVDEPDAFMLRVESLQRRSEIRRSSARGIVGARADLIPHQISIAAEVSGRLSPRVLLADEVGLGKTIEAGLVLHRLHLTGRADRVLIAVPETLIHQWFVELLRRFNLLFSIFDEERCRSIETGSPGANPFLENQLILCSVDFLAGDSRRALQAVQAGWNLLVVDEAHHLQWRPGEPSPEYSVIEMIAQKTDGVLLLTATPQQLGPEGHFARLRLLDPDRYSDLDLFLKESEQYERVAKAIDRLQEGKSLTKQDQKSFAELSPRIKRSYDETVANKQGAKERLISELLDSFGTGRVMFRNTRAALTGFPQRKAVIAELKKTEGMDEMTARVKWVAGLLKKLREEKFLLICKSRELAETVHTRLLGEINVNAAVFHEGLTLVQRDRNAAYFADPEGARILVCSEIGSEGRNFQFAHHLILFDLPLNPELLEQRIGRLDRIGQSATIHIHVAWFPKTESEVLTRWFHEGLNAFEKNPHGAAEIAAELKPKLLELFDDFDAESLSAFLEQTRSLKKEITGKLQRGYDRLLALASCRTERTEPLIRAIRALDGDVGFEEFVLRMLDRCGVLIEDDGERSYILRPGHLQVEGLPSLSAEGLSATFSRTKALGRDDLAFLTQDHPLVRGALDQLLGGQLGNSSFGIWKTADGEAIYLEMFVVAETVAPASLHVDRFLPPTPIRAAADHGANDVTEDARLLSAKLEPGDIFRLLDRAVVKKKILPAMLERAKAIATEKMNVLTGSAISEMEVKLRSEIGRLEDLREMNSHVRASEIEQLQQQRTQLHAALSAVRLRVDAVRLIFRSQETE